jgi:biopolymer transport protein TolR
VAISTGSSGGVNANINVTPMIDVMLVLLIIFMIVAPLLAAGFKATMPSAANVEKSPEDKDEVTLGLDADGNFFVNKTQMTKAQAEQELTAKFASRTTDKILFFKADMNLKYSKVQDGIEVGRRAGAKVLMAITERTGGLMGEDKKPGK